MRDNIDEIDLISLKIIEKNTIKKSTREANERKEDLARVLHRVENIYGEFEKPIPFNREFSTFFIPNKKADNGTNIEMVEDVPTLEQMLISHHSREKYLQQVTVFIVGYSKVAQDRLRLMQEVNQFFLNTEDIFDSYIAREGKLLNEETDEDIMNKNGSQTLIIEDDEPEYTVSELSESMEQSIEACQNLTSRLGELNNEMIECFAKYAQNKTGNKGKKKMDKALENAINDTNKLNEKLAQTSKILSEKDAKIDSLMKQCEAKSKDVQKFKAAAESIKKAALESDKLREQIKDRDIRIMKLESELMQAQMKVEEVKTVDATQRIKAEQLAKEYQEKSINLENALQNQRIEFEESKREMTRQHTIQLKQVQAEYESRIEETRTTNEQETKQLKSSEFDENAVALQWSEPENDIDKPLTKSLSSLSKNINKETKSQGSKSPPRINSAANKESRPHTNTGSGRSSGKDVWVFDNAPDLDDEDFWCNIPRNNLLGRFAQYRQMSRMARSGLQDDLEVATHATDRQIHSLKSQHQAHKHRWDDEREMLIDALKKAEEERKETQDYADTALAEIENFLAFMKTEDRTKESILDLDNMNMLEIAKYIRDYLLQQNLMKDPIGQMITTLIEKCELFQERTRISLPRFSTMINPHRDKNNAKEMIESNSQTCVVSKVEENIGILDENRDILLADESDDDEAGTRDVAVSASSSLLRIALNDYKDTNIPHGGVTIQDLEVPSNFVDIQDRTGLGLVQHPIVVGYLRSYDHILTFKEHLISILGDIDRTEVNDIMELKEFLPVSIRSQSKIIPQIEEMGKSIENILLKSEQILEKVLLSKKKNTGQSKDIKEMKSSQPQITKGKQVLTSKSRSNTLTYYNYMVGECVEMRLQIKTLKLSFISKFNVINNTVIKMRQLIGSLVYQLDKKKMEDDDDKKLRSRVDHVSEANTSLNSLPDFDSLSILFRRKDSETNIRRMHQAILQHKIDDEIYEEAVERMSDYLEIPAKRLLVLVKKYMHLSAMQKISEYVRQRNEFNADTFKILDKMEDASEKKVHRYDSIQEYFRNERIQRAQAMMDTFDKMQTNSSIFLIRPVLTTSSRKTLVHLVSSTKMIHDPQSLKNKLVTESRAIRKVSAENVPNDNSKESTNDDTGTGGKMWRTDYSGSQLEYDPRHLIESKLFEIDTNRMLLPMNNVSSCYNMTDISCGQSVLPPNVAVRSYVAVAHPTLVDMNSSPRCTSSSNRKYSPPDSASKSRLSKDLSKHTPLPPIVTAASQYSDILTINDDVVDHID